MNDLDKTDPLAAAVDAVFADAAAEADFYRDATEAIAVFSTLVDKAEADAARGNRATAERLQVLVAPLERLAVALGGGAR